MDINLPENQMPDGQSQGSLPVQNPADSMYLKRWNDLTNNSPVPLDVVQGVNKLAPLNSSAALWFVENQAVRYGVNKPQTNVFTDYLAKQADANLGSEFPGMINNPALNPNSGMGNFGVPGTPVMNLPQVAQNQQVIDAMVAAQPEKVAQAKQAEEALNLYGNTAQRSIGPMAAAMTKPHNAAIATLLGPTEGAADAALSKTIGGDALQNILRRAILGSGGMEAFNAADTGISEKRMQTPEEVAQSLFGGAGLGVGAHIVSAPFRAGKTEIPMASPVPQEEVALSARLPKEEITPAPAQTLNDQVAKLKSRLQLLQEQGVIPKEKSRIVSPTDTTVESGKKLILSDEVDASNPKALILGEDNAVPQPAAKIVNPNDVPVNPDAKIIQGFTKTPEPDSTNIQDYLSPKKNDIITESGDVKTIPLVDWLIKRSGGDIDQAIANYKGTGPILDELKARQNLAQRQSRIKLAEPEPEPQPNLKLATEKTEPVLESSSPEVKTPDLKLAEPEPEDSKVQVSKPITPQLKLSEPDGTEGRPTQPQGEEKTDLPIARPVSEENLTEGRPNKPQTETQNIPMARPVEDIKPAFEIRRQAEKDFGLPVRTGQVPKEYGGIYKTKPEVVRTREQNSLTDLTHEVAHDIQKKDMGWVGTNLPESVKPYERELYTIGKSLYGDKHPTSGYAKEGFAEFVKNWAFDETPSPEVKAFKPIFEKDILPTLKRKDALINLKDEIGKWNQGGYEAKFRGEFVRGEARNPKVPLKERLGWIGTEVNNALFDPDATLKKAQKEMTGGKELPIEKDPYRIKKAERGTSQTVASNWIFGDPIDFEGNHVTNLSTICKPVRDNLEKAFEYVAGKRSLNYHKDTGKWPMSNNLKPEEVKGLMGKWEKEHPEFKDFAGNVTEFNNNFSKYIADLSGIPREKVEAMMEKHPIYVPMKRLFEPNQALSKGATRQGGLFKKFKGSSRAIIGPEETIIENMSHLIEGAQRQHWMNALIDLADQSHGSGKWLEEIKMTPSEKQAITTEVDSRMKESGMDATDETGTLMKNIVVGQLKDDPKNGIIVMYHNGELKKFWVQPDLYRTTMMVHEPMQRSLFTAFLSKWFGEKPAKLQKLGFTGINPEFGLISNPLRDLPYASIMSKSGLFRYSMQYMKAIKEIMLPGEMSKAFKEIGGESNNFIGSDINQTKFVKEMLGKDGAWTRMNYFRKHPIELTKEMVNVFEAVPRKAEMMEALRRDGWKPGDKLDYRRWLIASEAAKNITMPFGDYGYTTQFINKYVPFFGPQMLGMRQVAEAIKTRPVTFFARGFALLTAPTLMWWYQHKDDPDFKEMSPWMKYGFMHIPIPGTSKSIPIPLSPELGTIFVASPLAMAESIYRRDPKKLELAWESLRNTFNAPIPTIPKVAYEVSTNQNLQTGRPIVRDDKFNPVEEKDKSNPWTTETAKAIGEVLNYSPAKIEHIMSSFIGTTGMSVIKTGETIGRSAGLLDKKKETQTEMRDIPFVRKFVERDPIGPQAESLSDFYEKYNDLEKKYNSSKLNKERMNYNDMYQYKRLERTSQNISKLRKQAYNADSDTEKHRIWMNIINQARRSMGESEYKNE